MLSPPPEPFPDIDLPPSPRAASPVFEDPEDVLHNRIVSSSPVPPPRHEDREPTPDPEQDHHHPRPHIDYDRRLPPLIQLDRLSETAVLPSFKETLAFISIIRNASLEDPIARYTDAMLARIRNPPQTTLHIDNPALRHSISVYLALEHASQKAYERVIDSTKRCCLAVPEMQNCLRFGAVEDLLATLTGIEPIRHDMCRESCVAFTGPFAHLDACPTCNASRWNEAKLQASRGRSKVPIKTFITIPLGPQLQALYRDPEGRLSFDRAPLNFTLILQVLVRCGTFLNVPIKFWTNMLAPNRFH